MPLSRPDTTSKIGNIIWESNPSSILDIGVGFGGYGVLFRQWTDIRWGRLNNWETIIDGIEINKDYQNPIWNYVYDTIFIGDASDQLPKLLKNYDIIFMGDILEHFEKEYAKSLINKALEKTNRFIIATTPMTFSQNSGEADRFNNIHEEHKCLLTKDDFPQNSIIEKFGNQQLIIINK